MFKQMKPSLANRLIRDAQETTAVHASIDYPEWYLRRWHFLPEGYLSKRSAAAYEALIRRLYNGTREERLLRWLKANIRRQQPESILELGCGPGRALEALANAVPDANVTGVDLSPFLLDRALDRTRGRERVRLVHADGTHLPWDGPTFDAIVAVHYFGHLPAAARGYAVEAARRVLTPNGLLYVIDHTWHPVISGTFDAVRDVRKLCGTVRLTTYAPIQESGR